MCIATYYVEMNLSLHSWYAQAESLADKVDVVPIRTDLSYEDATSSFADDLPCSHGLLWFPLKCGGGGRSGARWMLLKRPMHSTLLYKHVIGIFPLTFYVFLRIACTIPVTTRENERANSVLRPFYVILWGKRGFHH